MDFQTLGASRPQNLTTVSVSKGQRRERNLGQLKKCRDLLVKIYVFKDIYSSQFSIESSQQVMMTKIKREIEERQSHSPEKKRQRRENLTMNRTVSPNKYNDVKKSKNNTVINSLQFDRSLNFSVNKGSKFENNASPDLISMRWDGNESCPDFLNQESTARS